MVQMDGATIEDRVRLLVEVLHALGPLGTISIRCVLVTAREGGLALCIIIIIHHYHYLSS